MNKIFFMFFVFILSGLSSAFALDYDFQSTYSIPIKMSIVDEISTKNGVLEGEVVNFKIIEDVYNNDKLIAKSGDLVQARVSTVMTSGMNGFPAEIYVEDFKIKGISPSQLQDTYIKTGRNRCFWVYPLKWALTPIPGVGSLTNLIKGGHCKIRTKDVVTINYYPEWK